MSGGYWLGVDLGGTKILTGLFDDEMKLVARSKLPTAAEHGPAAVFERIDLAIVEKLLAAASEESSLHLVSFANQVVRQGFAADAVPDQLPGRGDARGPGGLRPDGIAPEGRRDPSPLRVRSLTQSRDGADGVLVRVVRVRGSFFL